MSKKLLALTSILSISAVSQAELNVNFDNLDDVNEITRGIKSNEPVKIVEDQNDSDNKVFRVANPNGFCKIPTGAESSDNFTFSIDWRNNAYSPGLVFGLTDFNHNKKFMAISLEGKRIKATTYSGKKHKMKRIVKTEKGIWYRFNVNMTDKNYQLTVERLGKDNYVDSGEIIYDSVEKKRKFKPNAKVKPNIVLFEQWGKKAGPSFDYDNMVFKHD